MLTASAFQKGERVFYVRRNEVAQSACVTKVYTHDPNGPYYDIKMDATGRERQTVEEYLRKQRQSHVRTTGDFSDIFSKCVSNTRHDFSSIGVQSNKPSVKCRNILCQPDDTEAKWRKMRNRLDVRWLSPGSNKEGDSAEIFPRDKKKPKRRRHEKNRQFHEEQCVKQKQKKKKKRKKKSKHKEHNQTVVENGNRCNSFSLTRQLSQKQKRCSTKKKIMTWKVHLLRTWLQRGNLVEKKSDTG